MVRTRRPARPKSPVIVDTVAVLPPKVGEIQPEGLPVQQLTAEPTREYVVGGDSYTPAAFLRTLPWAIDDIAQDFGIDIHARMLYDPACFSAVTLYAMAILTDGISLTPAVDNKDPGYEDAQALVDFCEHVIDTLDHPFDDTLYQLTFGATAFGNKVAEMTYRLETGGPFVGKLVLDKLKVKPLRATAYLVDAYGNVLGLMGAQPGQGGFAVMQGAMVSQDLKNVPQLLPRSKFAILSHRPKDNDPRGTSILRPAYVPWFLKGEIIPEVARYAAQFATPGFIGHLPPDARPVPVYDATGSRVIDSASGMPKVLDPTDAMLNALIGWRNGSAAVVANGAEVDLVQSNGNSQFLNRIMDWCDRQITQAILCQTLATLEGQHQSRAASETHQDALGALVLQGKSWVAAMIRRDILRPLVALNFGEAALAYLPKVTLGATEQQDTPSILSSLSSTAGWEVAPSQLQDIDAWAGLPVRSDEDVARLQDEKAAGLALSQKALTEPSPAPGETNAPPAAEKDGPTPTDQKPAKKEGS